MAFHKLWVNLFYICSDSWHLTMDRFAGLPGSNLDVPHKALRAVDIREAPQYEYIP